ncbi:putative nucleoside diphosphate kinase 5 [Capsicum annuum]|nr:putative nucleoside diphosphate kinase 5 [Capsicum annuum]KAF3645801.1 putative nucleoside diphosphate kinase 5 [Capsicum annuum]
MLENSIKPLSLDLDLCLTDSSTETERTLAIIKPDGVSGNHTDSVKETILNHGFKITEESFIQLDEDRVKSFYAEHSSRNFFPSLIEYMTRAACALSSRFEQVSGKGQTTKAALPCISARVHFEESNTAAASVLDSPSNIGPQIQVRLQVLQHSERMEGSIGKPSVLYVSWL